MLCISQHYNGELVSYATGWWHEASSYIHTLMDVPVKKKKKKDEIFLSSNLAPVIHTVEAAGQKQLFKI